MEKAEKKLIDEMIQASLKKDKVIENLKLQIRFIQDVHAAELFILKAGLPSMN